MISLFKKRVENSVLRHILNAPIFATISEMIEVGVGTMKGRIARSKIQYIRSIKRSSKQALKRTWERMK